MANFLGDGKDYKKFFSDDSFWDKLMKNAAKAGKKVVYTALLAYYAIQNPKVPLKAKATIIAALGYLILPVDLVPDFIPIAGYGDDLAALLYAIGSVAFLINDEIKNKAKKKMEDWFGPILTDDADIIDVEASIVEVEKNIDDPYEPKGD